MLAFDTKHSDGVEGFYTGVSDANTERASLPFRTSEGHRKWRRKRRVAVRIAWSGTRSIP
jgi:hypothetical protein